MQLGVVDHGVIYRNPLPGHRAVNVIYARIHLLPDGDLLCVLRVGQALYSPDGMLECFRSCDGGHTWIAEGALFEREGAERHFNYADAAITTLRDGSLVMRVARFDHKDPNQLVFNPATQGSLPYNICYLRSRDGGRSWSKPTVADFDTLFPGVVTAAHGGIIELPDGRWFQALETWKTYDDAGPFRLNTFAVFSEDEGHTWGQRVTVADGSAQHLSYSHGVPVRLQDGRIFVALWTAESQLQHSQNLHAVVSTDSSGCSWSDPCDMGIPGQTSMVAELGRGRMLTVYSHRETDQPGIKVVASSDGGNTWCVAEPLVVWDAYGKESLGVARSDTYPSSHDAIAFGAPRILRLNDDSAMVCFWCTQGGDTHCRWARVSIMGS